MGTSVVPKWRVSRWSIRPERSAFLWLLLAAPPSASSVSEPAMRADRTPGSVAYAPSHSSAESPGLPAG